MTAIADRVITFHTKPATELTPAELKRCRDHTLTGEGGCGLMQSQLDKSRRSPEMWEAHATLVQSNGDFVGWALTFRLIDDATYATYFYIHPTRRREGVGTELYRAVRKQFGEISVRPWDDRSRGFFQCLGAC